MGYRLLRVSRWDNIDKAPSAENGKIKLEGPNDEKKASIQGIINKDDGKKSLLTVEKTFGTGAMHYWLDLQRISANICKKLGENFLPVHDAICFETAFLLKRIPEIISLAYSDGTPFCDNSTKDWIESDIIKIFSSTGNAFSKNSTSDNDPVKNEKKEVNLLASSGKIEEAVEILQNKIQSEGSGRLNFKRSILLSEILISAKQIDIAIAILESCNEKIAGYKIDTWEPDLAVETWCLLYKAYKLSSKDKSQNIQNILLDKQNSILNRISCINPKNALTLKL